MLIKVKFLFFNRKIKLFSSVVKEAAFNIQPLENDPDNPEDGDLWIIKNRQGHFIRYRSEGKTFQTQLQQLP